MSLESICEVCGSPMCAFSHRVRVISGRVRVVKICVLCMGLYPDGFPPERTLRAIGALNAESRGYPRGRSVASKTRALIAHDRILAEGEL